MLVSMLVMYIIMQVMTRSILPKIDDDYATKKMSFADQFIVTENNTENCIKVYFNNWACNIRADVVNEHFVGSSDFSDGYHYEVPEELMANPKQFVQKLLTLLLRPDHTDRYYGFSQQEMQAPLMSFLDKYIKMTSRLLNRLANICRELHKVYNDYIIFGYYYENRHLGCQPYVIGVTFGTKSFANIASGITELIGIAEICTWDVSDTNKYGPQYSVFWKELRHCYHGNLLDVVYQVHTIMYKDDPDHETYEMYSYLCHNYCSVHGEYDRI